MEPWEVIVDSYPKDPDLRSFTKAVKTADSVLKADLADFEAEWVTNTLFYKPVDLLNTIVSKCADAAWQKPICDSFKLIGELLERYPVEHLHEDIVRLCLEPYSSSVRKDALLCLQKAVVWSPPSGRDVERLINDLEEGGTCKSPLAVLVGCIAEYHQELVADNLQRIWRIYLKLLESNKNTDTVISSVLQGILSLFKHFGQDLPIVEFRDLYTQVTKSYIMKQKCTQVCVSMLEHHSSLVPELLSQDRALRDYLWAHEHSAALRSVYTALAGVVSKEVLQKITDLELSPRASSPNPVVKYTALRVVKQLGREHGVAGQTDGQTAVQVLEEELRSGNASFEACEAILWCIETNYLYSDRLLQTAILFYNNIPSSKRRNIVIYGLLNAPDDVRTAATTLLINESCQPTEDSPHNIDKYLPLWKDLFDTKQGKDNTVIEKGKLVFYDVIVYVFTVLEAVLEEDHEILPEKISPLLTLTYHILTLCPAEDYTKTACSRLQKLLLDCMDRIDCSATAAMLSVVTASGEHCDDALKRFCKMIRLDKCSDEAVLCESCNLLIHAAPEDVDTDRVVQALEILFTRQDVEPTILSRALRRFEQILNQDDVDKERSSRIIRQVHNLRSNKHAKTKDERILHRDIVLFIGKYGTDSYTPENSYVNTVVTKLKDKLALSVLNTEEGVNYKINLQRTLQLAVQYEDADVLQKLLAILTVSLSSKPEPALQQSLTIVIYALCRAHAHSADVDVTALQHAVLLCPTVDCVYALLTYIGNESPGCRKMMSAVLEGLLGGEGAGALLRAAADTAAAMMTSTHPTTRSGGLNVTEALLSTLKTNHTEQKTILPELLPLTFKTDEVDFKNTFQMATEILIDNLTIYDDAAIDEIVRKLTEAIVKYKTMNCDVDVKIFKDKCKEFATFIIDVKRFNFQHILLENFKLNFAIVIFVMCEMKMSLDDIVEEILERISEMEIESGVQGVFYVEAVLKFLEVYADEILQEKREMTERVISSILTKISPNHILHLQKPFKTTFELYRNEFKHNLYENCFRHWYKKFNINKLLHNINIDEIHTENCEILKAVHIYVNFFNISTCVDEDMLKICDVILDLYVERVYMKTWIDVYVEMNKDYFSCLLELNLKYDSWSNIKKFILRSYERSSMDFLIYYVGEFSPFLLRKPYMLLDEDMWELSPILKHVIKFSLKRNHSEDYYKNLLEFVDSIWAIYSQRSTFDEKHNILHLLTRLPIRLHTDSKPVAWAVSRCVNTSSVEEKIKIVTVLPGGEGCRLAYRSLASHLPVRFSELTGVLHSALQALLDVLANTADSAVLDIVMNLAECDPTKGWWDEAIASSVAIIARRGDCTVKRMRVVAADDGAAISVDEEEVKLMSIATKLYKMNSVRVCNRMLIPLLRYSGSPFCELFYPSIIPQLLSSLRSWPRVQGHSELFTALRDHARIFSLVTLALEQIPIASLTSQESPLYAEVTNKQPSHLIREAIKLCITLRGKGIPDDASEDLRQCYRQCQVENLKALCSAVSVSRPAQKVYSYLFGVAAWTPAIDCGWEPVLPIRSVWSQQRTFQSISVELNAGLTNPGSVRTRVFLRTLSEDPLQYDLLSTQQESNAQELSIPITELNSQDVSVTLTALLKHASTLTHHAWREATVAALVEGHRNVKWTVAQVICNCKEDLSPHASTFRPALLKMTAATACDLAGRNTLNGLHVDVLQTILYWKTDLPPSSLPHLTSVIEYLINTAIDNGHRTVFSSLTSTLKGLVELYGVYDRKEFPWTGYEEYLNVPAKLKYLLQITLILTKQNLRIPSILNTLNGLIEKKDKYWKSDANLPRLYGQALACESERAIHVSRYRKFLARVRQTDIEMYVKMLYYTQLGYPKIVDEANFKIIADLAPKLVGDRKSRCLNILATYLEHLPETTEQVTEMFETVDICSLLHDSSLEALRIVKHGCARMGDRLRRKVMSLLPGYCASSDGKVRKVAMEVAVTVFQDLFSTKQTEPASKRPKLNSSPILTGGESPDASRVVECIARGVTDGDTSIASSVIEGVGQCLNNNDFGVRLAECFLLAICIPCTQKHQDVSVCVSAFLQLLLSGLRNSPRFHELRLRDTPLEVSESSLGPSRLLTRSRTFRGTFLSTTSRRIAFKAKEPPSQGINVQISINDILGSLLQFAKNKPDVSHALCLSVIAAVAERPGFDAGSMSRQVCDVLSDVTTVCDVTPLAVAVGRMCVDGIKDGFQRSLMRKTAYTEGEYITTLLFEEVRLRSQDGGLLLTNPELDDIKMDVGEISFPDDLKSAFGKLSNWDRLTAQQRKDRSYGLPQLWLDENYVRTTLEDYEVNTTSSSFSSWFDKLLVVYRDASKQDSLRWLRETDRWPRRHFQISAAAEAMQRREESDEEVKLCCDIRPQDCLVEWAARLMIRRAYLTPDIESEGRNMPRDHELLWCRAANDRGLPRLAVNCIDVNTRDRDIDAIEMVPWSIEKARALRMIGVESSDHRALSEALTLLESCKVQANSSDDLIAKSKLMVSLHQDLSSLTNTHIDDIMQTIDENAQRQVSNKNKAALWSLYELIMNHYDAAWENEDSKPALLQRMASVLELVINLNHSAKAEMFLAAILNRLGESEELDEHTSRCILDKISLIDNLDDFTISTLKSHSDKFRATILSQYPMLAHDDNVLRVHRQLSLVRDPMYWLWRRCDELGRCDDASKWNKIFGLIKENIFEHPFALEGTEYRQLLKYKEDLYSIEDYETTDQSQRNAILSKIIKDPRVTERETLNLSQLCPSLTRVEQGSEQDRAISKVLQLGTLSVVKFYEQVAVFTNAVTRPAVLKVLLSDGTTKKYIVKSGESLRMVGACQRSCNAAKIVWGDDCFVGHSVIQLSEDSGLLEYLEDTVTFRQLITGEHNLDDIYMRLERFRISNEPLERYNTYCSHIPAYMLRLAIEKNCSSIEDFIRKKQRFLKTLGGLTLLGSIFGLGDRHLENLLYSVRDGSACSIDWASLQYGVIEPVPARLTRNILAVNPGTELEAHLQKLLSSLRASSKLFMHVVAMSFNWMGDEFLDKLNYISLFVSGDATTYDVMEMALSRADAGHRHRDTNLTIIRNLFRGTSQRCYTVEEQIQCLLRHCTEPAILANTRKEWEPWI